MSRAVIYRANPGQLRRLHQLLNQLDLMGEKKSLIAEATNGQTTSSKDLSFAEARNLIRRLEVMSQLPSKPSPKPYDSRQKMVAKVFALMYQIGYLYAPQEGQTLSEDDKRINSWIANELVVRHGHARPKKLDDYTTEELHKLVNQFESWRANNELADIAFNLRMELREIGFKTGPNKLTRKA